MFEFYIVMYNSPILQQFIQISLSRFGDKA